MPKTIELTVEIVVQRVSCPGVWLCQDGSVSLIVFALGTSYETCTLPPIFPLQFNDKLYFRKRFEETCALSNMCCLLKDETLYCELVQWCQNCEASECNILAQYLGSLSDVLFPPKMCCNDGVDLLMRRSKKYPGILSPKIEIATKVRIDEVWNDSHQPFLNIQNIRNITNCHCLPRSGYRQKPVCHSAEYHRNKCGSTRGPCSRSRSRSRSGGSGSCSSLKERVPDKFRCAYTDLGILHALMNVDKLPTVRKKPLLRDEPAKNSASRSCKMRAALTQRGRKCQRDYCVFNVKVPTGDTWKSATGNAQDNDDAGWDKQEFTSNAEVKKVLLESRYVDDDDGVPVYEEKQTRTAKKYDKHNYKPCVCEICQRYHELFHTNSDAHVP